jgi:CelD/BcsL family acetyltransferase involved in cellulose biosynthesis
MTQCHFRVVVDETEFTALEGAWAELYRKATERNYTESFDWCLHAWEKVAKPRDWKLFCLLGTERDRLVLVWPFVICRKYLWSLARPLGPETTEYSNILVEDGPDADTRVELAWRALRRMRQYDVLWLPYVRDDSRLHRLLAANSGFSSTEQFTTSMVDWGAAGTWETYYQRLSKKQRLDTHRRRRRLMETGNVTFVPMSDIWERSNVISWILDQKRRWLLRTSRQNDWMDTAEYRDFLVAVAGKAQLADGVFISVLKLDERIIAASIQRMSGSRVEIFLPAFDPEYRNFAPNLILYEHLFKWCFDQRLEVDFRIGDESYKDYWGIRKSKATSYEHAVSNSGAAFVVLKAAHRRWLKIKAGLPQKGLHPVGLAVARSC